MDKLDFKDNYFIYSYNGNLFKVLYDDIISIESDKPYVIFHLKKTKFSTTKSLLEIEEHFHEGFVKISRQIIVNIKNVKNIIFKSNRYWIHTIDESEYLISRRRENEVRTAYLLYV